MKCNNKHCKHTFFYKEYDYMCCPACGEIKKETVTQNDFDKVSIIEPVLYLPIEKR